MSAPASEKRPVAAGLALASQSPRRLDLLRQIGIEPELVFAVEADETPLPKEKPRDLAKRLSIQKAELAVETLRKKKGKENFYVLAADTVVSVGRRILPKAESPEEAEKCLRLLSGRAHRVYTGVSTVSPKREMRQRTIETRLRFKRLSDEELKLYLGGDEWRGKAGGYGIQGFASCFVIRLIGSYTNVVGLPLYETHSLLRGLGFKP